MKAKIYVKKNFTSGVLPSFILLAPLLLLTVALNWHTAAIERTLEYTISFVHGLSIGSLPYYILALLGFALSHTENGKRIILPVNICAVATFILWFVTYIYLVPPGPWLIDPLVSMLNTQILIGLSIAVIPFIYFYASGLKLRQKHTKTKQ